MKEAKKHKTFSDDLPVNKYVIQNDISDIRIFQDVKAASTKIRQTAETGEKVYPLFKELHQDLFSAFFKYKPKLNPKNSISYLYSPNYEIINSIIDMDKYKELRAMTRLDELTSAVAMEYMGEKVFELIDKFMKNNEELMSQISQALDVIAKLSDMPESDDEKEEARIHYEYEDAVKLLERYKAQVHEIVEKTEKHELGKIVEEAAKAVNSTNDLISSWGLGQDPNFTRTGYQDKIELLNRLRSHKLQEITKLVGRYRRLAVQSQREKAKKGLNELFDIVTGRDIQKLVPSELIKLITPELEDVFYKDYSENNLLQYESRDTQKKQKGPIIICIDNSGSMHGQPEIWSKALALGMLEIARMQKRSCFIINFDSAPKENLVTFEFLRNEPYDINKVIDMCEFFNSGGTDFEPPLELSRDKINHDGNYEKADIVFITDGECPVSNEWLKQFMDWKKEKKVSIYSILIDLSCNTEASLLKFSNELIKLNDLRNAAKFDETAVTLFTTI